MSDLISRKDAIKVSLEFFVEYLGGAFDEKLQDRLKEKLEALPPIQPEIIRCKDCQYWNSGSCESREHAVNCQDYMVGDIETEAEYFCGYAEKREANSND